MSGDLPAPRLIRQPVKFKYLGGRPPEPPPLVGDGLMHPLGITMLYGSPGIGKGWVACHVIRSLQEEEYKPLILDFEGVTYEWRQRLWGMGIEQIPYYDSSGPLTARMAANIREAMLDVGVTHVFVDSASAAKTLTAEGDAGGQDVTMTLFRTLKLLGTPIFMIGHQGKTGAGPIGSIHFMSQSRLVWHAIGIANGTELEMVKANDRMKMGEKIVFTRVPGIEGRVNVVRGWTLPDEPEPESLTDAIIRIVYASSKSMSPSDVQIVVTHEGVLASVASVTTIMGRLVKDGRLEKAYRGYYRKPNTTPTLGT